jgi:hypothetical protein
MESVKEDFYVIAADVRQPHEGHGHLGSLKSRIDRIVQ